MLVAILYNSIPLNIVNGYDSSGKFSFPKIMCGIRNGFHNKVSFSMSQTITAPIQTDTRLPVRIAISSTSLSS